MKGEEGHHGVMYWNNNLERLRRIAKGSRKSYEQDNPILRGGEHLYRENKNMGNRHQPGIGRNNQQAKKKLHGTIITTDPKEILLRPRRHLQCKVRMKWCVECHQISSFTSELQISFRKYKFHK